MSNIQAVPYFYDKQLRRYIQQFIRIFAGFQVAIKRDNQGNTIYQTVPVRYGDVNRMAAHIVKENSENMLNSVPFISAYVTGLEIAPNSRTYPQFEETVPVYEKKFNDETNNYDNEVGNSYAVKRHQPVPYNLTMQVDIWTSNTEQKLQLLEQILVLFNPSLNIHTSNNAMDWSSLSYVELTSNTWSMRAIPGGVDDIIDISSMTFEMPVLINPPAKVVRNTVIHTIIDNIENVRQADLDALRNGDPYTPLFTSYRVVTLEQYKMKFSVDNTGSATAQLLNRNTSNLDDNGNVLDWQETFTSFGEIRDGVSQIRLKQTDNPGDTSTDIVGTITTHPTDPNLLSVVLDTDTIPSDTYTAVDSVLDPAFNYPGDGTLPPAADGQRYLLLSAIPDPGAGWLSSNAQANDIIQYNSVTASWDIVFDSTNISTTEYTTNITTKDKLKWTGTTWINAFEGTYNPGYWRIYL
jgi:hypothetical protein